MSQDNFNVLDVEALIDECLIAKKIYGRCKQQDCLKPVECDSHHHHDNYIKIDSSYSGEVYSITADFLVDGTIGAGELIQFTDTVKSIEVKHFKTDVKVIKVAPPGPFCLPGFYDVTIQYTFSYKLSFYDINGCALAVVLATPTPSTVYEVAAYTTYTKVISLEGGVVDPHAVVTICDTGISPHHNFVNHGNVPYAYVQAIANPLLAKAGKYNTAGCGQAPVYVYQADVVIGLFTIIELYRITNMSVASNGPVEIPQCEPSITNDPCDGFNKLLFPYDDFDPPYRKC